MTFRKPLTFTRRHRKDPGSRALAMLFEHAVGRPSMPDASWLSFSRRWERLNLLRDKVVRGELMHALCLDIEDARRRFRPLEPEGV